MVNKIPLYATNARAILRTKCLDFTRTHALGDTMEGRSALESRAARAKMVVCGAPHRQHGWHIGNPLHLRLQ